PPQQGAYHPEDALSAFAGESQAGTWTLEVTNDAAGESGTLNAWGLRVTYCPSCSASTPTSTPTATPVLVGHVTWQGHTTGSSQALPLTLTLRLQSGGPDNEYTSLTTDASGFFTVSVGSLSMGAYNWHTKGPFGGANNSLSGTP